MATHTTLNALFTAIANAIRGKTGGTGKIVADDFPGAISALDTSGITPTGTKTITTNGTHDVTQFASALVNVPVPAEKMVVLPITISEDLGAGTNKNQPIVTGNDFVKQHYADDGFAGILVPLSGDSINAASGVVTFVYHGNRPLIKTSATYYGCFTKSNGPSSYTAVQPNNAKINAKGYNVSFRVDSAGTVNLYVASNFTVKAGNYLLVLLCTD